MRLSSGRVRANHVRNVVFLSVIGLCPGASGNVGPWCCEQPQCSIDSHNVVIAFSVIDGRGRFAILDREDFAVYGDQRPQTIFQFGSESAVPLRLASVAEWLVIGILLSMLASVLFPCIRKFARQHSLKSGRRGRNGGTKADRCDEGRTRQRLGEEKAFLDDLEAQREYRGDPLFGKAVEDRVIWNELLYLELHDIDEQLKRICQRAWEDSDQP